MPEAILVVGDIHAGSTVGLMPPDFLLAEGQIITHNVIQKHLWSCWTDLTQSRLPDLLDGDGYDLLLAGDLVEGVHHKTVQVISSNKFDHSECAIEILRPVAEQAKKTYILKGTEVHTGSAELAIGKALKAVKNPDGHRGFDKLDIEINGHRAIFVHHVSTAMRTYLEASGVGIQMNQEQLEASKMGEKLPTIFGYAHRHRFGMWVDASGSAFVSPPWQGLTRHGHKVVNAARTVVGAVLIDWRGMPKGARPRIKPLLYHPNGSRIEM